MAASPTVGDIRSLHKLARQIKSQPVKLQYWPLTATKKIQEVFMILLTFQTNIAWQLLHKGFIESGQESCLMLTFTLILESLWSSRPSCLPGVKTFLYIREKDVFFPNTLKISLW